MKRIINIIAIIIAIAMVMLGLILDFNPRIYMSGTGKIIIYVTPMIVLFLNMIYQIKKSDNKDEKESIKKKMLAGIFIIYIIALATLLFIGSTYRVGGGLNSENSIKVFSKMHFENFSNLIPFKTIIGYIQRLINGTINSNIVLVNILGNLIAFAPTGFFIPVLFGEKIKSLIKFASLIAITVLIVEIIQFITFTGQLDVDDIILNTVGAVPIFLLMKTKMVKNILQKLFE